MTDSIVERNHHSYEGAHYVFPADEIERERLNLLHRIFTKAYEGRLVFPPITLKPGDRVLDSGTGSGAWITDCAKKEANSVLFHGVDIESKLFPDLAEHQNISLSVANLTHLPSEWTNRYSLVNQRLMVAALTDAEWDLAVKEMFRVTRPGGWVQLTEVAGWKGGEASQQMLDAARAMFASRGLDIDSPLRVSGRLKEAGFENIHVEERTIPLGRWAGKDGEDGRRNFEDGIRGMKKPILDGNIISSEAELEQLYEDVVKEWDTVDTSGGKLLAFYAQKPDS
ncbi:S-adenosyl-L-methionine-dependent methyltransferase [Leucogyrophana mollusca]|uniref:S-adenosyl-L-methionine-dependent methyltransferase n=1 Tax=Leucogyrophana mollusca TaxID=85980 RepID=A0ACB8BUL8_9AGAM|nr:S-adenosyl-L-methionine-dependent methyltransferase [Leucogyrophana mollusca]